MGRLHFVLAAGLALAATGCSDDEVSGGSGGSAGSAGAECGGRGETFSAGMSRLGENQALEFTLLDAAPAPPQQYDNVWTLQIDDAAGAPVESATLSVKTWMPDHGHGSPKQVGISQSGGGTYVLDPVNLFMAGLWEITIDATPTAGSADSVTFSFCIGG